MQSEITGQVPSCAIAVRNGRSKIEERKRKKKSEKETVNGLSRAWSQSRGARRSRVLRATPRCGRRRQQRRYHRPLFPVTLRLLVGPQGYRSLACSLACLPAYLSPLQPPPPVTDLMGARATWSFPRFNNAAPLDVESIAQAAVVNHHQLPSAAAPSLVDGFSTKMRLVFCRTFTPERPGLCAHRVLSLSLPFSLKKGLTSW